MKRPRTDDVVIHHQSPGIFTLGVKAGRRRTDHEVKRLLSARG